MKQSESKYKDIKLISTKNLALRRLVYIFFIIIFLVTVPLIILYTQGYRYNFKRGKVQKTGIFIISSIPKKADIYLNNQLIKNKQTPARIEKLLPADYEIKLAKTGYHDWTKKLQISKNATTFAEDVILWKNIFPTQLSSYPIINWLVSSDQKKVAFITDARKIISFDFDNHNFYDLYQASDYTNPQILAWSNTNKKILVKSNNQYLIIDTERYYIKPLKINNDNYSIVKWDLNNDNIIYALNSAGIWKIDLFTMNKKLIFPKNISDFIINHDTIYYFYKDVVYKQKLNANINPEIIDGVKCSSCHFWDSDSNKLILFSPTLQELYIIDPELKNKTIKKEASNISWLNKNDFLFYNNWEIWIYSPDKKEPELITRIGAGITEALWHPIGRHIIFTSEDKIKIIELDNRELRNIIELYSGQNIHHLTIDDNGQNIYFSSMINQLEFISELNIK